MKPAFTLTRRVGLAGMAAALGITGCTFLGPRAERWTPPPAGASWEIAQRNTGSYGKDAHVRVTRGEAIWQGAPVITFVSSQGTTTLAAPNGHWIAVVGRDGKTLMSWDPPLGFEYPMTVGKSWVSPFRMTLGASGKTVAYDLACKIESHEKVTVKAGTFDAFKVVCSTSIGNEETYWTHPDMGVFIKTRLRRTDKSPFGPGTQDAELVAAPALSN